MSSDTLPITFSAFAEAIKELPIAVLYAKVSELRNSIAHLRRSNDELRTFVNESCESESEKQEIQSYANENEEVVTSMMERIQLLRVEVEGRGHQWIELDSQQTQESRAPAVNGPSANTQNRSTDGSGDNRAEEEDGVHL